MSLLDLLIDGVWCAVSAALEWMQHIGRNA